MAVRRAQPEQGLQLSYSFVRLFCYQSYLRPRRNCLLYTSLIDTAASYTNEDAVGEAVREAIAEGICTREELFITSKMWVQDMQNYEIDVYKRQGLMGISVAYQEAKETIQEQPAKFGVTLARPSAQYYYPCLLYTSRCV